MKKNNVLLIGGGVLYVLIIILSAIFMIVPGAGKLVDAGKIVILTNEEKVEKRQEIDNKYMGLEADLLNKYNADIEKVNKKYDDLEKEIKSKYDTKENEIVSKYANEAKELQTQISNYDYLINKEFMANGFSKKYYELDDKRDELQSKKSKLILQEADEKSDNNSEERKEISKNESARKEALKSHEDNKEREISQLSQNKLNEINSIENQETDKMVLQKAGIKKIVLGIVIIMVPLLYVVIAFNSLTRSANRVKERWSQVDVCLKQRADLIPNLVEVVKGYAKHEKGVYINVTKARNKFLTAESKEDEMQASTNLDQVINKLFFLQEAYPELKADKNFISLQAELREIEDNISFFRQMYNHSVLTYKNKLEMFPSNVIANLFNFKPESFFEIEESDKTNPKISI